MTYDFNIYPIVTLEFSIRLIKTKDDFLKDFVHSIGLRLPFAVEPNDPL